MPAWTRLKFSGTIGVDHVGYGFASFGDLVATYERLKKDGTRYLVRNAHRCKRIPERRRRFKLRSPTPGGCGH